MSTHQSNQATFRVLDAMDAPHGGRILRLRLQSGEAPGIRKLKGATMRATSPDGEVERTLRVRGFAITGGQPSDDRLARTGRVDVHVDDTGEGEEPVSLQWHVKGPVD